MKYMPFCYCVVATALVAIGVLGLILLIAEVDNEL